MTRLGKKKRPVTCVNGFKASREWYDRVKKVAEERHTTIGGAIQIVFNLGLPIYEKFNLEEKRATQCRS